MNNKINIIATFVFSFVFFGCCGGIKPRTNYLNSSEIVDHSLNSTVALVETDGQESAFYCAGVYINPTTILTARHCIVDMDKITTLKMLVGEDVFEEVFEEEVYNITMGQKIKIADYSVYKKNPSGYQKNITVKEAKIAYVTLKGIGTTEGADENDLALLKVAQKDASRYWAEMPQSNSRVGDKIFSIGMPIGQPWIFSEGMYAQNYYKRNIETHIYANIFVAPGSSGGPLFNAAGELIGIASAYLTIPSEYGENHSELGLFVHTNKLKQYLGLSEKFK